MVVRGGYGIFYEAEGTDGRLNFNFIPFRVSETLTAAANTVPTRTLADYWLGVPVGASWLGHVGAAAAQPGRDQRWNFGFQRQLFSHTALEVDYVGTTGDHQTAAENINLPPAGPAACRRAGRIHGSATCRCRRRRSRATTRRCRSSCSGRRWGSGISSRIPTPSRPAGCPRRRSAATTPTRPSPSRGTSRTCSAPVMATSCRSARAQVPVECRRGANAIVGGWQFQNIISYRSGLPYTPTISRDVANIGVGGQRPNRVGSGELENPTIDVWFDKTAFVVACLVHVRRLGPGHPALGSPVERRHVALQAIRDSHGQTLEFRAERVQRAELDVYSTRRTRTSIRRRGKGDKHVEPGEQIQFGFVHLFSPGAKMKKALLLILAAVQPQVRSWLAEGSAPADLPPEGGSYATGRGLFRATRSSRLSTSIRQGRSTNAWTIFSVS